MWVVDGKLSFSNASFELLSKFLIRTQNFTSTEVNF